MKLIVVSRDKIGTFRALCDKFAAEVSVDVILDRRTKQVRERHEVRHPDRRKAERRKLSKDWQGRDYFVIYAVENGRPPWIRRSSKPDVQGPSGAG